MDLSILIVLAILAVTVFMLVLDVRAPKEFANSHIEGALNIPVADLRTRSTAITPAMKRKIEQVVQ